MRESVEEGTDVGDAGRARDIARGAGGSVAVAELSRLISENLWQFPGATRYSRFTPAEAYPRATTTTRRATELVNLAAAFAFPHYSAVLGARAPVRLAPLAGDMASFVLSPAGLGLARPLAASGSSHRRRTPVHNLSFFFVGCDEATSTLDTAVVSRGRSDVAGPCCCSRLQPSSRRCRFATTGGHGGGAVGVYRERAMGVSDARSSHL